MRLTLQETNLVDGADLRQLRLRLELTQAEMAEVMGLSERTYYALEVGSIPTKTIHKNAAWAAALLIADDLRNPAVLPEELYLLVRRVSNDLS